MSDRVILHCDCNGFFASVESILRPELRTVPMAVCGDPESRHGIILAKNELAKKYDVRTAETIWQARRKCPDLVLVRAHHGEYSRYSHIINEIYQTYTDLVEPFGIDESWLDITGSTHLFGSGPEVADALRVRIRREVGLTVSVGVSFCKVFAKLGSDYKKPDATTVIARADVPRIVWPLPVNTLLFVGKQSELSLRALNIKTIGDLAHTDPRLLEKRLGKLGTQLSAYARGEDQSPVAPYNEETPAKSVGNGMTFRRDLVGESDVRTGIATLSDQVAARMRRHGVKCQTVQLTIKDTEMHSIVRQRRLEMPSHLASQLTETCLDLWRANWSPQKPIRMLTVTGENLIRDGESFEQMMLWSEGQREKREKRERLESAVDGIREKYGRGAVKSGAVIGNDLGIDDAPIKNLTENEISEEDPF
ncbi:MAG: DNA polymerase IV [Clostridiaceae bacterium]|nr:DNA polymerase IV [Clostridiaceae bacterium]